MGVMAQPDGSCLDRALHCIGIHYGAIFYTVNTKNNNNKLDLLSLAPKELYKYYFNQIQPIAHQHLLTLLKHIYRNNNAFILFTPIIAEGKGNAKAKSFNGPITYNQFVTLIQASPEADYFSAVAANLSKKTILSNKNFNNSNKDSSRSGSSKGLRNSAPPKEESASKFYNNKKENKVTFDVYAYKKALVEFNNLKIKYSFYYTTNSSKDATPSKPIIKIKIFDRPTPEEIYEFNYEGCYFSYRKKRYISSECPYKEKLSNIKKLIDAPISNEESPSSSDIKDNAIKGN
ncbi:hypothetical protein GE21DRAFT_1312779 [Neurospora crassa]|nr:hypothetical protein GE21DRAFT_1312779 [Neurospora crassa]